MSDYTTINLRPEVRDELRVMKAQRGLTYSELIEIELLDDD